MNIPDIEKARLKLLKEVPPRKIRAWMAGQRISVNRLAEEFSKSASWISKTIDGFNNDLDLRNAIIEKVRPKEADKQAV